MSSGLDDLYGNQRGPSFSRGGRGGGADPYSQPAAPTGTAPPGGRSLPAGYVPPAPVHSTAPSAPRPDVPKPSAAAREAANEQASMQAAKMAETAHAEAMAALKSAGEARAAQSAQQSAPAPSASHTAAHAAAQVANHTAPRVAPPSVPTPSAAVGPMRMHNANPAGQVVGGIPINQVYADFCSTNPLDPNCVQQPVGSYPPSGIYNPQAGNPSLAPNMSARIPTGSLGVGQMTGQVTAGTVFGNVGGIYRGVTQPGIYGAAQANMPATTGTSPEEAWLNAIGKNADGFLDLTPTEQAYCLAGAGCDPMMMNSVLPAVNYWCTRKTGRQPYFGPSVSNGIIRTIPSGQAIVPAAVTPAATPGSFIVPAALLLGAAAIGIGLYVSADKKQKSENRAASARRSSRSAFSKRLEARAASKSNLNRR